MILHIFPLEKFTEPFFRFGKENFRNFSSRHFFYIYGNSKKFKNPEGDNVLNSEKIVHLKRYFLLIKKMNSAEKIIIHGLWGFCILVLLAIQPWLLKKCYWAIWGGDIYIYRDGIKDSKWHIREFFRRIAIKKMGHFITHVQGDYELAQEWYGAGGVWHECFMYPSNLYSEIPEKKSAHRGVNILLGNSADSSNNHLDALDKLSIYDDQDIAIFCPLSYGNFEYGKEVADYGKEKFNKKFNPIFNFFSIEDYLLLLSKIDIAIFNHQRQQGMGNIINLLGFEKKIFMNSETTSYQMLKNLGLYIFSLDELSLEKLNSQQAFHNKEIIKNYFSKQQLARRWEMIYE